MNNRKMMSFVLAMVIIAQLLLAGSLFAASAPDISYFQIAYVGSTLNQTNKGVFYESMQYLNQTSTANDHGGTQLLVVTEQLGYDAISSAKMNGVTCSRYKTEFLYVTYPTVAGFRYYWNCSGQQQGTFTATAYSTKNYRQWNTTIYVK